MAAARQRRGPSERARWEALDDGHKQGRDAPDEARRLPPGVELLELPRFVAPSAHRAGLPHPRVLPAHRPDPGGREVPPRLLRRPPRDARPLRGRHGGGAPAGDPGGQDGPHPPHDRDGARDEPDRPRRHLLDDLLRALSRRAGLLHPRPHDRGAGGLERGDVAQRFGGRELRAHRAPAPRPPLRPRRRVHGGGPRQLGRVGGRLRALRPGRPRLRRSGEGASSRLRRGVVPDPRHLHRAVDPPGAPGDHPGRPRAGAGASLRRAGGRSSSSSTRTSRSAVLSTAT